MFVHFFLFLSESSISIYLFIPKVSNTSIILYIPQGDLYHQLSPIRFLNKVSCNAMRCDELIQFSADFIRNKRTQNRTPEKGRQTIHLPTGKLVYALFLSLQIIEAWNQLFIIIDTIIQKGIKKRRKGRGNYVYIYIYRVSIRLYT